MYFSISSSSGASVFHIRSRSLPAFRNPSFKPGAGAFVSISLIRFVIPVARELRPSLSIGGCEQKSSANEVAVIIDQSLRDARQLVAPSDVIINVDRLFSYCERRGIQVNKLIAACQHTDLTGRVLALQEHRRRNGLRPIPQSAMQYLPFAKSEYDIACS